MNIYEEVKKIYENGGNVSKFLREKLGLTYNNDKIIELTYDLQSGSYVEDVSTEESRLFKKRYTDEMAGIIHNVCPNIRSMLKGGTGECITLTGILKAYPNHIKHVHGFDMCWSRIGYGQKYLIDNHLEGINLCTGSLSEPPFKDNAFQMVVTSHSMEPNGGREKEILESLYRVSGQWLVLFEPSYQHASEDGKIRMEELGYVKNIHQVAEDLGYEVVDHFPLKNYLNPLNPTAVTIIKKNEEILDEPEYACPISLKPLVKTSDGYFSERAMCLYPEIMGLPCLKKENAIIASKYPVLFDS